MVGDRACVWEQPLKNTPGILRSCPCGALCAVFTLRKEAKLCSSTMTEPCNPLEEEPTGPEPPFAGVRMAEPLGAVRRWKKREIATGINTRPVTGSTYETGIPSARNMVETLGHLACSGRRSSMVQSRARQPAQVPILISHPRKHLDFFPSFVGHLNVFCIPPSSTCSWSPTPGRGYLQLEFALGATTAVRRLSEGEAQPCESPSF